MGAWVGRFDSHGRNCSHYPSIVNYLLDHGRDVARVKLCKNGINDRSNLGISRLRLQLMNYSSIDHNILLNIIILLFD